MSDANTKGLDAILKALKENNLVIRTGILGSKGSAARDDGKTNAEVGAAHEYGTSKLPVRSFLRMPLATQFSKNLDQAGAFDRDALAKVIQEGSFSILAEKIAVVAEATVQDAFDTGGFGQWKPSDMRYKKVHQTLVETQQLRNSVTSIVIKGNK